jgi:hypothetical protein
VVAVGEERHLVQKKTWRVSGLMAAGNDVVRTAGYVVVTITLITTFLMVQVTEHGGRSESDEDSKLSGTHGPGAAKTRRHGNGEYDGALTSSSAGLGRVQTVSCKTATTADYTVQCCAEAESDAVHLSALARRPSTSRGEGATSSGKDEEGQSEGGRDESETWHSSESAMSPIPVPRRTGKLHVLVTGGAGYVGSHAALQLLEDGHAVTIVDNLSRGSRGAIEALKKVARPKQLRFVLLDLGNPDRVVELFVSSKFDVVIHFAALAYVAESYMVSVSSLCRRPLFARGNY